MRKALGGMVAAAMVFACLGGARAADDMYTLAAVQAPQAIAMPAWTVPGAAVPGAGAAGDTRIALTGDGAVITGDGAYVSGAGDVVITESGDYIVTGTLVGHSLVVDTPDKQKVELVLDGVDIRADGQPCVHVLAADKNVTLNFASGSVNLLSCAYSQAQIAPDGACDAAIFSKADLKIMGDGALYITCTGGKGVNGRDDVAVLGGNLFIQADDDGLRGKDSVTISGGETHISAGADGLRASNDADEGKGNITLSGGAVYIQAGGDAAQAYDTLTVSGGVIVCKTGDGAGAVQTAPGGFGGRGGMNNRGNWGNRGGFGGYGGDGQADGISQKALKADKSVVITGGVISVDSADDGIHANGGVDITGGEIFIRTGDDGVHGDEKLVISGGNILIAQSYEGLEAADIQIQGGTIRLTASDDGVNAAGGAPDAAANQGFGRGRMMWESSGGTLTISGGYLCVNAGGDGLDCNGNAVMTGGFAVVYGPTNSGNGPLDYGGSFTFSGGLLMASGSAGMAQTVSAQGQLAFTCSMQADTLMVIASSAGGRVLAFKSPKDYNCVVLCADGVAPGASYDIYAGGEADGDAIDGVYYGGEYKGGTLLGTLTAR